MPAIGMMVGGSLLSSFSSAQGARIQAMQARESWKAGEIARAEEVANQAWFGTLRNADKWATNKAIGKEALRIREQSRFWDNVKNQNITSELSKGMRTAYENLRGELTSRMGSNSATSRALLRSSMQNYYKARENININETLQGRMREQAYQQTLATRDFGFTPVAEFRPSAYVGVSPGSAYNLALVQGLAGGAASIGAATYSPSE